MATLAATPAEVPASSQRAPQWPFWLYALTGFTGVLAEQGFEKYMSLLVGATAAASAVVIFAYFLGFALGSWATGRLVRRGQIARPLRTYGVLELLVGLSCVGFSYWFHPVMEVLAPWQALYASPVLKFAIRFAFGSVLILPTAALMGASFPLIALAVDRRNESHGHSWLRAYALNLTGAVIAALSGAYLIMPLIGIRGVMWLCFAICSGVFLVCVIAREQNVEIERRNEIRDVSGVSRLDRDAMILLAGAFASGFVFFALEVIWTHLIGIAIGASVYAFSAMLTMVLLGLLIGAFRVDRIIQKKSAISYSKIFQYTALLLVIQLRMWDWGQTVYIIDLPRAMQNFFAVEAIKLALAAVLIVPSAAMLGAIYPCLLRSPVLERPGQSFLTGYLNSWNSLGCLTGAITGIFVLIPALGAEWSLKLMIVAAVGVSLLFLSRESPWGEPASKRVWKTALGGIAIVLIYAGVTRWDKRLIASGMNVYFGQVSTQTPEQKRAAGPSRDAELIFFDEAAQGGITSVIEFTDPQTHAKERVLLTNGKFEGSDDLDNQGRAQIGFAAIPSQYVSDTGRALLIGLGTGHSALALARMGYGEIDVAEFAPGIIKASRSEFARLTEGALDFSNVSVKLEDGRNLLQTNTQRSYDLITVEITSVWFAGATNVYSSEFYELAKKRLKPGGALQQWIQLHHISPREVESEIATARSVFPYVSFWYFGGQGIMVGTSEPQSSVSIGRREALAERMKLLIRRDAAGQKQVADEMFGSRVMSPEAVDRMIAARKPVINTDHNRWLEYATPRYNSSNADWVARNLEDLRGFEGRISGRE
jgi:spermidine synthase